MPFLPGLQLCEQFYQQAVRPLLDSHFPGLPHSAALIGPGSEVLGFDDPMSTDHDWGPRVLLFLHENDQARQAAAIHQMLANHLPHEFHGYPTNFSAPDPADNGTQQLQAITHGPVNHRVTTQTIAGFFAGYLGLAIGQALTPAGWLTSSEHKLRTLTAGAIYHDDLGLRQVLAQFRYYPNDIWRYLLAADWTRIGQEEHLTGRAGQAGDEIGAALIAARLVRSLMHLCFLMARTYAPYPKWYGTAFAQLACATNLTPLLQNALRAHRWPERQAWLVQAYELVAAQHNALGLTAPQPAQATPFFGRPFQVIAQNGFAAALLAGISDPAVKALATRPIIGSLEQFSDSTDLIGDLQRQPVLRQLYR